MAKGKWSYHKFDSDQFGIRYDDGTPNGRYLKKRGPKWRYDGIAGSRSTTEHEARKHDDGNRLVKLKPEVSNLLAVEESRWNETWKS